LATLQAKTEDKFREAEPGKIPHEVRHGELSIFEKVPHSCYYGSVDSTPLYLILLSEAYQWTGDLELGRDYLKAAEAALNWIDQYGDPDGDGFVEYKERPRPGLKNQGWKDSEDSTCFASGELAESPIALSEVQGYVYAAKTRLSDLYRRLGEFEKAERLSAQARDLKKNFNQKFWMPKQQFYAMALDGRKNQVDGIASNAGHCLWSGIVDEDKASYVVRRLMDYDMFTGWGIRTLSSEMRRYDPLSYHNGSVWPHDTSIAAAGMHRYGFSKEASALSVSLLDAATLSSDRRVPELFAGFVRRERSRPIPYPAANSPQAWASGAIIYCIETLLGLTTSGDQLMQKARLEGISLSLSGVKYRGISLVL
jgi:glycogen debranching enzyme